ncbi:tyrosine-type recombinase/integrase, partial [Xenorhabdus hominickii]|uniref:tyrosine-type recombinase/integrase n=1 Tax=Xenorhabdus hominickii TaxID=351679 RepID=UPI003B84584E
HSLFPLGVVFGVHQNFAPGTGFSSISYPEFGLISTTIAHINRKGGEFEHFTVHDIRRTGSTLLHELGFNTDWIEKCLAHEQSGVRAVYNKAEYAIQRADMLQQWANMLDSWKATYRL